VLAADGAVLRGRNADGWMVSRARWTPVERSPKDLDRAVEPFGQELPFGIAQYVELGCDGAQGDSRRHRAAVGEFGSVGDDATKNGVKEVVGQARIALLGRCCQEREYSAGAGGMDEVNRALFADAESPGQRDPVNS
jgi:hypothetical protein